MKIGSIMIRVPRKVKKGEIFKVMSITKHPMDTGLVKNPKTGKIIPMWIMDITLNISPFLTFLCTLIIMLPIFILYAPLNYLVMIYRLYF